MKINYFHFLYTAYCTSDVLCVLVFSLYGTTAQTRQQTDTGPQHTATRA